MNKTIISDWDFQNMTQGIFVLCVLSSVVTQNKKIKKHIRDRSRSPKLGGDNNLDLGGKK